MLSTMFKLLVFVVAIGFCHAISDSEVQSQWEEFQTTFKKSYKSPVEASKRLQIFKANLDDIEKHNELYENGKVQWFKGVNQFSDWTSEEFSEYVNQFPVERLDSSDSLGVFEANPNFTAPQSVDWRQKGAVTGVKNQGQCGSCWSFSSTGALEGQVKIKRGTLNSYSEQNLVDCCSPPNYRSRGCSGGFMVEAFRYIKNSGIALEQSYPYHARQGMCRQQGSAIRISGYREVARSEQALEQAVATIGPISVGIDAIGSLQSYRGGIYSDSRCNGQINHAVLAVGYGVQNGTPFWIIKNSWATTWGEQGYVRMLKGRGACGIVNMSSYPIL